MSDFTPTTDQAEIIAADRDSRILVQAGPGTGKTEVVARRLVHLVGKCDLRPSQILVLSFSRSAVKALISRIRSLDMTDSAAIEELRFLAVRSFDSWSFRMLRLLGRDPRQLLQNEYKTNIELLVGDLGKLGSEARKEPRLGLQRVRHFIVDEYQDIAGVRATLVQKLLEILTVENEDCGFTVLGDPYQAIYDWSVRDEPANGRQTSRNLVEWIKSTFKPGLVIKDLGVNHRASPALSNMVSLAAEILSQCDQTNEDPTGKLQSLIQKAGASEGVEDIFEMMTAKTKSGSTAILCRSNSKIFQLITRMKYLSWERNKEVSSFKLDVGTPPKVLPSWIAKLLHRYKSEQIARSNFIRVFSDLFPAGPESPCSGDPGAAWQLLLGYARLGEEDTSLDLSDLRKRINWPDTLPDDEGETDDVVTLTTIHQSKGLEYKNVRIISGDSPDAKSDCQEEGRVLFVGMSRARELLTAIDFDDQPSFFPKEFDDSRRRWYRWTWTGMQQIELGCQGDLNPQSIVRGDLMGGPQTVKETQEFLARHEGELLGSKVTLEKTPVSEGQNKFHYKITVAFQGKDWCLGFLNEWVTRDLLKIKRGKQWLPKRIHNLTIGAITTSVTSDTPHWAVPSPWKESRFWLTVAIHGIGQFKIY
jgi:DNA helicase-2/ATP-dependent DNA helicase PcrA